MKNLVENAVRELHADLRQRHANFCGCAQCGDDVVAYVMNHARPRYATSPSGWAVENAKLWSDQTRAELTVVVLEGMKRVAAEPRHAPGRPVSAAPAAKTATRSASTATRGAAKTPAAAKPAGVKAAGVKAAKKRVTKKSPAKKAASRKSATRVASKKKGAKRTGR